MQGEWWEKENRYNMKRKDSKSETEFHIQNFYSPLVDKMNNLTGLGGRLFCVESIIIKWLKNML